MTARLAAGLITINRDAASCEGDAARHKWGPQTLPSHAAAPAKQGNPFLTLNGSEQGLKLIFKACLAVGILLSPKQACHMAWHSCTHAGGNLIKAFPSHLCGASDSQRPVCHAHAVQACACHICHGGVGVHHKPIPAGRQEAEHFSKTQGSGCMGGF